MCKFLNKVSIAKCNSTILGDSKKLFMSISRAQVKNKSPKPPRHSIYSAGRRCARYLASNMAEEDKKLQKIVYKPASKATRAFSAKSSKNNQQEKMICYIEDNKVNCIVNCSETTDGSNNGANKYDKAELERRARRKLFDNKGFRCTFNENFRQEFVDYKPIFAKGKFWTRFDNILDLTKYTTPNNVEETCEVTRHLPPKKQPQFNFINKNESKKSFISDSNIIFKDENTLVVKRRRGLTYKDLIKIKKDDEPDATVYQFPDFNTNKSPQSVPDNKIVSSKEVIKAGPRLEISNAEKSKSIFTPKTKLPNYSGDRKYIEMESLAGTWICKKPKRFEIRCPR